MASSPDPAEVLAAHSDFVQRVARALLGEEGDDVAQQALLRAMHSPPRDVTRSYFVTIVRRLALNTLRGRRRRHFHEGLAHQAREEAAAACPSPQQVLEREETRRRIIDAVLSLDEPFQQAVLMRFYEAMTPAQIAVRLGVPGATVRTRLQRGLERLRWRLDDAHGRDRSAWAEPLLQCLGATVPDSMFWVVTMKKTLSLAAAAIALLACLVWWQPWNGPPLAPTPDRATLDVASASLRSDGPPAAEPILREPVELSLHLVVVDEEGRGVGRALVHLGRALVPWLPDGDSEPLGETSSEGTLTVPGARLLDLDKEQLALYVHHEDHRGESLAADRVAQGLAAQHPLRVVLHRGCTQTFTFRMRTGEPVPGQTVVVSLTDAVDEFTTASKGRPGTSFEAVHRAVSDARGEATFRGLPAGVHRFCVAADPRLGVVEGARASQGVQVPGPPVALTLDWLLAGGVVVRGDVVVTGIANFYTRQLGSSFANPHEAMVHLLHEACPELATNDAPLAWVGFPNPRLRQPQAVSWSVLLARTGWHQGVTTLRAPRDGFTPDVLTIPPDQPDAPTGEVVVDWPAHLPLVRFELRPKKATLHDFAGLVVTPGQPMRVRPGEYELAPFMQGSPDLLRAPNLHVVVGETTRVAIKLPDTIALGEVTARLPSGRIASRARLQWRQLGRDGGYSLRPAERALVLLPTGTVDVTLWVCGCETVTLRVEVAPNDVTPIAFHLQAAR